MKSKILYALFFTNVKETLQSKRYAWDKEKVELKVRINILYILLQPDILTTGLTHLMI